MNIIETSIPGVKIIEPQVFGDARGWFVEQYNAERYKAAGICADFVQDNESFSSKGVVRGLHWQAAPHTQAKLVRVLRGAVWDVIVDKKGLADVRAPRRGDAYGGEQAPVLHPARLRARLHRA